MTASFFYPKNPFISVQKVSIFSRKAAWPVFGDGDELGIDHGPAHFKHLGIGGYDVFLGGDQQGRGV